MNPPDWIAKRMGYVKASEISAYEALLEEVRKDEERLQAKISSLEEKAAASDATIADMQVQLAQHVHAALQSGKWKESIDRILSDRGLDLNYLLNGNRARHDPSKLDTYNKLRAALDAIPEIRVIHATSSHPPLALNIFQNYIVELPTGKINNHRIRVAQIFNDLGIEDRLVTYSEQH